MVQAKKKKNKIKAKPGAEAGHNSLSSVLTTWDHSWAKAAGIANATAGASCPSRRTAKAAVPVLTPSSLASCGQDSAPALRPTSGLPVPARGPMGRGSPPAWHHLQQRACPQHAGRLWEGTGGGPSPDPHGCQAGGRSNPQTASGRVEKPRARRRCPTLPKTFGLYPNLRLAPRARCSRGAGWLRELPPRLNSPRGLP